MSNRKKNFQYRFKGFVITVNVTSTFTIPTDPGETYNYNVTTSDGHSFINQTGNLLLTFSGAGVYQIFISGTFPSIYFNDVGDKLLITSVDQWGEVGMISSNFRGCSNLVSLADDVGWLNSLTNGSFMFWSCSGLTTLPNTLTLQSLVDGTNMFLSCGLTSLPTGMILNNLTNGTSMFGFCPLSSLPTGMTLAILSQGNYMFRDSNLTSLPTGMNLNSLTTAIWMFINSDLASLPTGMTLANLTTGNLMFQNTLLTSVPSGMTLASLTSGISMFNGCTLSTPSYSQLIININANNPNSGVTFHGGNSSFDCSAVDAWLNLDRPKNWTITDEGAIGCPNTFIGGVGASYITTPADYISAGMSIGIVANDIKDFQIDGSNNVSFWVGKDYSSGSTFNSQASLTYFIDLHARYTIETGASYIVFANNANAKHYYFPRVLYPKYARWYNCNTLKHFSMENITTVENTYATNFDTKLLYFPLWTSTGFTWDRCFSGLNFLERLYIPALVPTQTGSHFRPFNNLNTGCKIYHHPDLSATNRVSWGWIEKKGTGWTVGDIITINGLDYTAIIGTPTLDGEFDIDGVTYPTQNSRLATAINNDTRTGTVGSAGEVNGIYTLDDQGFVFLRSTTTGATANTITIDETGVSGGLDSKSGTVFQGGTDVFELLMYLRDDRSATLIEVNNIISVDPPTSLSISNQTATSVDLNFTAPTPNANGTETFEVWVDDGTPYRYLFEFAEVATTGATLDLTDVFNDVGTISGTKVKIRTMDGQMNFSTFSNEITIP